MRYFVLAMVLWASSAFGGVVNPGDDLAALVQAAPQGEVFTFAPGVYRTGNVTPKQDQQFIGQPGAILSGAKVIDGMTWVQGPTYWASHGHTENGAAFGTCDTAKVGNACQYPEELFFNDVQLQRVVMPGPLSDGQPGTWFFDTANDMIVLFQDPTGAEIELASLTRAFTGNVSGVVIRGLTIERYANPAQQGAIHGRQYPTGSLSNGWLIEDCVIQDNHGMGISTGHTMTVRRNYLVRNGQLGMGGAGTNVLVHNNRILQSNTRGFDPNWEAGATKFVGTVGLKFYENWVEFNAGPGIWTDFQNTGTEIYYNTVRGNEGPGIFHEISGQAVIHDNYVVENDGTSSTWGWGAGILISSSHDVEIYDNIVLYNKEGIALLQQTRGPSDLVENVSVHDNLVSMIVVDPANPYEGQTGMYADNGDTGILSRNNVFVDNTYIVDTDTPRWRLGVAPANKTWAEWKAGGMDMASFRYLRQ